MHTVIFQQMRTGFYGCQIIDGDDFNVGASSFYQCPKGVAANAAEAVLSRP